jgi:hypothetical protein
MDEGIGRGVTRLEGENEACESTQTRSARHHYFPVNKRFFVGFDYRALIIITRGLSRAHE